MTNELPKFHEIADLRIAEAGPRDKNINIKVAINTARMMVESEQTREKELLNALKLLYAELSNMGYDHYDCMKQARRLGAARPLAA